MEEQQQSEREQLKAQANILGLKYPENIMTDKLRTLVQEELKKRDEKEPQVPEAIDKEGYNNVMKLVRIVLTPNDPNKNQYNGEIFTVMNSKYGTVKKYIPFNNQNGWHVPNIMVQMLKEKEAQIFESKKVNGKEQVQGKLIKAYNVQILPPLTAEELAALAQDQRARQGLE
jgi:N4 gp55-like protein|nr:MAG TPA: hypothetical protein [Caudoviricetes sp.]